MERSALRRRRLEDNIRKDLEEFLDCPVKKDPATWSF
jgi:hypothetical protein